MSVCQRCVVGLLVVAVCGAAAAATDPPAADPPAAAAAATDPPAADPPAAAATDPPAAAAAATDPPATDPPAAAATDPPAAAAATDPPPPPAAAAAATDPSAADPPPAAAATDPPAADPPAAAATGPPAAAAADPPAADPAAAATGPAAAAAATDPPPAAATDPPAADPAAAAAEYLSADNGTELGDLLGTDTLEGPAGSSISEPGTGEPSSPVPGTTAYTSADHGTRDDTSAEAGTSYYTTPEPGTRDFTSAEPGARDYTSLEAGIGDFTSPEAGTGDYTSAEPVSWDPRSEGPGDVTSVSSPPGTVPGPPELLQPRSIRPLVTPVSSLCICDLLVAECDINCCCDPDCSAADFSVFSECSVPVVTGDSELCKREAILYSISSSKVPQRVTETVEVINPNIFCIQATNYQPALSFITPDDPTEANFHSLLKEFGGIDFNIESDVQSPVGSAEARKSSKYEYGSPILTRDSYLKLPAPLGTSECTDSNPVGFLENQDFTCSRNIEIENCSIPVLNLGTYINSEVLAVPNLQNTINVSLHAITIKSIDGAVFRGNISDYIPSYDNTTGVCNHVVLGGSFTFTYTDKGEITGIAASFVLGTIDKNTIQQNFQIRFIENGTAPAPLSGNPGYVFGLPVVAGFKLQQSGIIQSTNRFGQLTLLKSSNDQNCLAEEGNRTPVLFGYNMMSGCKLRVNYTNDGFCKFAGAAILNVLQGQQFPNYVAQFGNSQPENILDWVPINIITTNQADVQGLCTIPVSLKLEVRWTKFGSFVNPQAQIVSVEKNIAYASFPNNLEGTRFVQIASSVTFLDLSQPASPGYKSRPTIDAKLPFDFFHPFL